MIHDVFKVGYPDFLSPCALGHQLFLSTKDLRINVLISKECDMEDRFLMYRTSVWSRQTYSSILKPRSQYVLHTYSFVCALNIFR